MVRFSKISSFFILSLFFSTALMAQEQHDGLSWYTNINEAFQSSTQSQKPIFAFFTGSDWCGWCHKLENDVFEKPGFQEWAKKNVVLLLLDFPRNKQLPPEQMKQNGELQQFFQVQGYPTIWMFYMNRDTTGNRYNISALGSLGYPQAARGREEEAFLDNANHILKNKQ